MKINWTTITEDKSTWPHNNANFNVNPIKWFLIYLKDETIRSYRDNENFCFDPAVNLPIKIKDCVGKQWRPMPKPPKKKVDINCKIAIPAELFRDLLIAVEQPQKANTIDIDFIVDNFCPVNTELKQPRFRTSANYDRNGNYYFERKEIKNEQ